MKASCVPILGILGQVIVNWDIKKLQFLVWKCINSLITQKPLDLRIWNLNTMWFLFNALCKLSWGAPSHLTKILQSKNALKMYEFEPISLGNYRHWWKMVCDFWAHYQPPFFLLCSFIPTWILLFLFCIFFLTFFLSYFFRRYLLLNR